MFFSTGRRRSIPLIVTAAVVGLSNHASANPDLVDVKTYSPSILVDLRYATPNNVTGRPLYSPGMRALVLPNVAQQLAGAQKFLRYYNCGLKIWDAYRPREAQQLLWQIAHKGDFITNPEGGVGSLHSWGIAVDATLADLWGHELSMPTAFDEFTPAAAMFYRGGDPTVQMHLRLLQIAMGGNNFSGLRIEWWHFITADWKKYIPEKEAATAATDRTKPLKAVAQKSQNSKS